MNLFNKAGDPPAQLNVTFKVVGVVGAGVMGAGVAQNLAQTGHRVLLVDIDSAQLERARREIRNSLRMQTLLGKKPASAPGASAVLSAIEVSTSLEPLREASFVIENVVEKWDVKAKLYAEMDGICPAECVFGANTSAISITRLGSATRRPGLVAGMHFMNPVPMKDTVEVIRGFHTTEDTLAKAAALLRDMGKTGIVVNDMPGFVTNRVLMLTINEAIGLVQDQVAEPEKVDGLFESCFGHTMGPLKTADLIGLDTILLSLEVLLESYNDPKYRPCALLKKMVHAGLTGRKSGRGFYCYDEASAAQAG